MNKTIIGFITVLQTTSSWMSIWLFRKRRCHLRGTRLGVTHMVWACGLLHILLPSVDGKQLICVCVSICVCVCVALWIKLTKASNCAAHGLLASDPSWSLVWNVIYLGHASPCALKTKIFVELPTELHYLLTTNSTYYLLALFFLWLKTSALQALPYLLLSSTLAFAMVSSCFMLYPVQPPLHPSD